MSEHERQMRFWMALVRTVAHFTYAVDQVVQQGAGISLTEKLLLHQLSSTEGSLRMVDLAAGLGVTKAAVTKMVDRLEKGGLVERKPSAEDRRVIHPVITEAGRDAVQRARSTFYAYLREHLFDHVDEEEMDRIAEVLEAVLTTRGVRLTGPVMLPRD